MTKNGETLKYRVEQLEKVVCRVDERVDTLMENHIPHLEQAIKELDGKVEQNKSRLTMASVINVGAILLAAALLKFV